MGREIRKVVKDWQHPKDESENYIPQYEEYFEDAFNEWDKKRLKWLAGEDPDADKYNYPKTNAGFIQWNGVCPDPEYYRNISWTEEEACCFQMYETVSEGTPVSPVFESLKDLEDWLVNQGHSRVAAQRFCESGYAPSMTFGGGQGMRMNIDTLDD